ncbi:dsDNA nuclease domain-containing protein, partial [Serratia marcescens]
MIRVISTRRIGLSMGNNILGHAQRENSGATTFGKYNFQYHWALCKIIEKHKSNSDYALLIEHHEDVVIADSLYGCSAKFELFQVKNTAKPFTSDALTKREEGAKGPKSSILGKLLSSC